MYLMHMKNDMHIVACGTGLNLDKTPVIVQKRSGPMLIHLSHFVQVWPTGAKKYLPLTTWSAAFKALVVSISQEKFQFNFNVGFFYSLVRY